MNQTSMQRFFTQWTQWARLLLLVIMVPGVALGQTFSGIGIGDYPGIRPSKRVNPGIASGSHSGFYIRFAEDIAALCARYGVTEGESEKRFRQSPKFRLNVIATNGGFDSVKRLRFEGEVQMAIVQSDLWYFADRHSDAADPYGARLSPSKRRSWAELADCIRLVLPLYTEKIHIVVRRENQGGSVNQYVDLMSLFEKKARVNIGTHGSGSMITCTLIEEMILEHMRQSGKKVSRWRPSYQPSSIALSRLVDKTLEPEKQLDAVIFVGGVPYPALDKFSLNQVKEQARRGLFSFGSGNNAQDSKVAELSLLPFGTEADRILDRHPRFQYVKTTIAKNDYPFLAKSDSAISTRGVTACLVTHRDYKTSSSESHKILWVRHVLHRVLTKLDQSSEFGLVEDFGEPKAGEKWLDLWENRDDSGSVAWQNFGWKRHDDQAIKAMQEVWASGYQNASPTRIIDPDLF